LRRAETPIISCEVAPCHFAKPNAMMFGPAATAMYCSLSNW